VAQDLRQVGGAELAGSAGAVRQCGEPDPRFLIDWGVGHTYISFSAQSNDRRAIRARSC
jgi:hypothetical protein